MLNFGYCIWIHPNKWEDVSDGFKPHMSLYTNLTYEEAIHKYKNLPNFENQEIKLGEIEIDCTDDFWSVYYMVENDYDWLPHEPHVSFIYDYNKPISEDRIQTLKNRLANDKTTSLTHASIMKCDGHYSTWQLCAIDV